MRTATSQVAMRVEKSLNLILLHVGTCLQLSSNYGSYTSQDKQ
jgi:hypothetical protein